MTETRTARRATSRTIHVGRARRQQEEARQRQRRIVSLAAGGIVVIVAVALAVKFLTGRSSAAPDVPAPPELVAQVAAIPAATFEQVGKGSLATMPTPIRAAVARGTDNLPLVTYIGAEYCPYCAAERWALVAALGRFGTFSGLKLSHSATEDIYPNPATFSFVGSGYTSQYVAFSPVELQTNVRAGASYQPLQTPTPRQENLLHSYDAAPYVPTAQAGAIPFIDFADQYVVAGASFDVGTLRGMTQDQIAASLADTSSAQAKAILGAGNVLTAAICSATGDQPGDVCGLATVKSLETSLAATAVPAQ